MSKKNHIPAIICTGTSGRAVVYGLVEKIPLPGESVVIHDARMVLRWDKHGLFGLASLGPAGDTRITSSVPQTTCECRQSIEVTLGAKVKIDEHPAY